MFLLLLRSASQQVYIGARNADGAAAQKTWSEKYSTRSDAQQSYCWLIQGKNILFILELNILEVSIYYRSQIVMKP